MKKKSTILFFIAVILAAGWWTFGKKNLNYQQTDQPVYEEYKEQEIRLVLDFGEGLIATYSGIPINNLGNANGEEASMSAFGLLRKTAEKENFKIETEQYDFGIFVKSIAGRESSAEKAWIYFVNGEAGNVAASEYKLNEGDVVEWKYIKPN